MSRGRRVIFSLLAALLLMAVGLIIYGETRELPRLFRGRLVDLLPDESTAPGWQRELRPIADTPEMVQRAATVLKYDEALCVVYSRDDLAVEIYMAYWRRGKTHPRLVAGHTPDVCWVGAGWTCDTANTVTFPADNPLIIPAAEYRLMARSNDVRHVVFWHRLLGPGTAGPKASWFQSLRGFVTGDFDQRHEQLFVRISAAQPVSAWGAIEPLQQLLPKLPLQ